jgi:hypothetical protein
MTKSEAQLHLMMGSKITHKYFADNEFIKKANNPKFLEDERGYLLDSVEFWRYRNDEHFNDGWELFTEKQGGN